jgi:ABC-type microcin C transport system permease subunit YejE
MLDLASVNIAGVVVSAIAYMIVGMLWYSPGLFGRDWAKLSGIKKSKKDMTNARMISFVGALITAYVLSLFITALEANTLFAGALIGFWAWVGFVGVIQLAGSNYEEKSFDLWLINSGYLLVTFLVMGGILGSM